MIFAAIWIFHYLKKKLKCFSAVQWNAVTKNILTNEQMTTIANSTAYWTSTAFAVAAMKTLASSTATATATATAQVQSKKKPTWKWSGEEDALERGWDDTDTMTLTRKEINYMRWYNANKDNWHNADED